MTDIASLTVADLTRLYRRRTLSPVEVARDALARIERFNPTINAFLLVDPEGALASASESEKRWAAGAPLGLVDGVPATVKDNVLAKGWPCRRGSATTSDAPVAEETAGTLAVSLLELGVSAILQLNDCGGLDAQRRIIGAFVAGLMRAPRALWHPVLVTLDEGAVHALEPDRVLILPDGVEDLWSPDYADLVALA